MADTQGNVPVKRRRDVIARRVYAAAGAAGWSVTAAGATAPWIALCPPQTQPPAQGWKIHLTAALPSAIAVFERAWPLLQREQVACKIIASLDQLWRLNTGGYGATQVGKFLTIYPQDDTQAVRLAAALDLATAGLRAPAVPSDRPLRPGSLVSYRYGSFTDRYQYRASGEVVPIYTAPDGTCVPDERRLVYQAPPAIPDPFSTAGISGPIADPARLIAGRYLPISPLYQSPRGCIHLALDLQEAATCVLKQAGRNALLDVAGCDARDDLRHEAVVLATLAGDPRFPTPGPLVADQEDLFLPLTELIGVTSADYVAGRPVSNAQIVTWGGDLAALLSTVHAHGWIYGDIKSSNVIVAPDGTLRLLDFGLATAIHTPARRPGAGTPGYMSPQQRAGARPTVADDVYGLGAWLYFVATGAEPSQAPRPNRLWTRRPTVLNPALSPAIAAVIARCIDPRPRRRPRSPALVTAALVVAGSAAVPSSAPVLGTEDGGRSSRSGGSSTRFGRSHWVSRLRRLPPEYPTRPGAARRH